LPPVPSSPIADTPPAAPLNPEPEQPKEEEQKQEDTPVIVPVVVPVITERRPTMETPPAVADDNIDEYAQLKKHDDNKHLDVDASDSVTKRRTNTFSNLPSATEKQSSGSPIQRRNTDSSRPARKEISPENDVVYQHTTSVVKSVIEFNTGVQHAQPEEFVDLVKVYFFIIQ